MANEKQLLIEALKKSHDVRFTPGVYEHSIYGKAALLLEKSEEVVRCKDCKHYIDIESRCDHPMQEAEWCYDCWIAMTPSDFCSCGERRTEDGRV